MAHCTAALTSRDSVETKVSLPTPPAQALSLTEELNALKNLRQQELRTKIDQIFGGPPVYRPFIDGQKHNEIQYSSDVIGEWRVQNPKAAEVVRKELDLFFELKDSEFASVDSPVKDENEWLNNIRTRQANSSKTLLKLMARISSQMGGVAIGDRSWTRVSFIELFAERMVEAEHKTARLLNIPVADVYRGMNDFYLYVQHPSDLIHDTFSVRAGRKSKSPFSDILVQTYFSEIKSFAPEFIFFHRSFEVKASRFSDRLFLESLERELSFTYNPHLSKLKFSFQGWLEDIIRSKTPTTPERLAPKYLELASNLQKVKSTLVEEFQPSTLRDRAIAVIEACLIHLRTELRNLPWKLQPQPQLPTEEASVGMPAMIPLNWLEMLKVLSASHEGLETFLVELAATPLPEANQEDAPHALPHLITPTMDSESALSEERDLSPAVHSDR